MKKTFLLIYFDKGHINIELVCYKYSENKKIYDGKILLITDSFVIELIIYEYNFEQYKISEKMDGYIFICDITSQKSF